MKQAFVGKHETGILELETFSDFRMNLNHHRFREDIAGLVTAGK
jgi:hypothetical protein